MNIIIYIQEKNLLNLNNYIKYGESPLNPIKVTFKELISPSLTIQSFVVQVIMDYDIFDDMITDKILTVKNSEVIRI